jgi:hypothetical protein
LAVAAFMLAFCPVGILLVNLPDRNWVEPCACPPQTLLTPLPTIPPPPVEKVLDAYAACGSEGQLLSHPDGLNIDTSKGANGLYVNCILQHLEAPSSVYYELSHTLVGETRVDKWGSEGPAGTGTFSITWHVDDKGNLYLSIIDNR